MSEEMRGPHTELQRRAREEPEGLILGILEAYEPGPDYERAAAAIMTWVVVLAVEAEREACAAACENLRHEDYSAEAEGWIAATIKCAADIRARPSPPRRPNRAVMDLLRKRGEG